jgi:transmembrane sensor
MLDFDGASLDQAAAQFARYSDYALHVDPDVANRRVTGRFMATDARGFAKAVGESLGLTVEYGTQSASVHQ